MKDRGYSYFPAILFTNKELITKPQQSPETFLKKTRKLTGINPKNPKNTSPGLPPQFPPPGKTPEHRKKKKKKKKRPPEVNNNIRNATRGAFPFYGPETPRGGNHLLFFFLSSHRENNPPRLSHLPPLRKCLPLSELLLLLPPTPPPPTTNPPEEKKYKKSTRTAQRAPPPIKK
eukprot:FR740144.1.p1 GENE.FR740144.1~~FR740144.1.p1  ORF type:complete len:174 (+),score=70.54 FR740144.1:683-1204(+)